MRRVIYTSHATELFEESDLFGLVSASSRKNGLVGVTGFLLYANRRFFQLLEGPEDEIAALYAAIQEDARHERCDLIVDESIHVQLFSSWSMRRVPKSSSEDVLAYLNDRTQSDLPDCVTGHVQSFFAELSAPADT